MVKQIQRSEIHGFSKGLNTDLNPLNNQPDTTKDERNFELQADGTRARRLGFDREAGFASTPVSSNVDTYKASAELSGTYVWEGAGGDATNRFACVQIGAKIMFYSTDQAGTALVLRGQITLPTAPVGAVTMAAIEGFLAVAYGSQDVALVDYSVVGKYFSVSTFRLVIRDQFGIEETVTRLFETDPSYRGRLNWQHYYNLYNQSWAIPRKPWVDGDPEPVDAVSLAGMLDGYQSSPSNSDMVWAGLSNKPVSETSTENFEAFSVKQFEATLGVNTNTAKGYFLIDAFRRGSGRSQAWIANKNKYPASGRIIDNMPFGVDMTSGGITSIAAHAGRVFYSGINGQISGGDGRSPNLNNFVFFSQLVKSPREFGKCYQEGDPTSRENADLVDTDGGFIKVSEAVNIHQMYSVGDRLICIAENGVWSISGGSGYGFSATNYKVEKVSTYGGIPNRSFVEYGGTGFFWGWDGLYAIMRNQYGDYEVSPASKDVIDNLYDSIPEMAKRNCRGFVDKVRRQIRWVYSEGGAMSGKPVFELVFDIKFKAFVLFEIQQTTSTHIIGGFQSGAASYGDIEEFVTETNGAVITDTVLNAVSSLQPNIVVMDSTAKYATAYLEGGIVSVTMCEYRNTDFIDLPWVVGGAFDARGFMVTNAFTGGDFAVAKQVPYLTMAFAETEKTFNSVTDTVNQESSCLGTFMWNFSHRERSNAWTRPYQLYRKSKWYYDGADVDNGFSILTTKTKVRGIGRSFSLKVETEPLKDCHIYGWSLSLTGNGVA